MGLEWHPHSSTFPSRCFFSFTAQPQPGFLPHRCALGPPAPPTSTETPPSVRGPVSAARDVSRVRRLPLGAWGMGASGGAPAKCDWG